ncbi:hypothetical protein VTH06DRAFT_5182 [Thermothelomyces fergusii]
MAPLTSRLVLASATITEITSSSGIVKMVGYGTPDKPIRIGEVNYDGDVDRFPCIVLSGSPRQRGLVYGLLLGDKIKANVARHLGHPFFPSWDFCLHLIQRFYIPGMKKYWPNGFEELEGVALGSGVYLEHLMLLNARDDLTVGRHVLAEGMGESTSAFFSQLVTADYVPLLAHSWTSAQYNHDLGLIVCLEIQFTPDEELPSIFMVTEAGMISGCGINAHGVAVAGNRLISSDDCIPRRRPAFPVACLDRLILERPGDKIDPGELQYTIFDEIDRYASRHLLIANKRGDALSIELGVELGYIYRGKLGSKAKIHTNHFQSFEAFQCRREIWDVSRGRSSQFRLARLTDLVEKHGSARLSMQQIVDAFSDHDGGPESICQHGGDKRDNMTIGLVMLDTNRLVISVCKGPPCQGTFTHFTFRRDGNSCPEGDEEMSGSRKQLGDATDKKTRCSPQLRETSSTKRKSSTSSSFPLAIPDGRERSAAMEKQEMVDCGGARKKIRIQLGNPIDDASQKQD